MLLGGVIGCDARSRGRPPRERHGNEIPLEQTYLLVHVLRHVVPGQVVDERDRRVERHGQQPSRSEGERGPAGVGRQKSSSRARRCGIVLAAEQVARGAFLSTAARSWPAVLRPISAPATSSAPTVIADLAPESAVVREEIFGPSWRCWLPTLSKCACARQRHAVWPDCGGLHPRPGPRAWLCPRRSRRSGEGEPRVGGAGVPRPVRGTKDSSSGSREQGKAAREFFTEWKTVYIDM